MKGNPKGLSGESVQPSDDQSRLEGFFASRCVMKSGREMSKRSWSVMAVMLPCRLAKGELGSARTAGARAKRTAVNFMINRRQLLR